MGMVDFGYRDVDVSEKSGLVRSVFAGVASRYDVMNDVMSFGLHRYWKRVLVSAMRIYPGRLLLDVAAGSGDIARLFLSSGGSSAILCDVSEAMLGEARRKAYDSGILRDLSMVNGDAEALPFGDSVSDIYSIGFGLRNVARREAALAEAYRVLKPGGQFLCLEFCPSALPALSRFYDFYSFEVIPRLGGLIADDAAAYRYLVESIRRFPPPRRLSRMLSAAGFTGVDYRLLSGGVVAIHSAWRTR